MIHNFKLSKDHVYKTKKTVSAKEFGSILYKMYLRKLTNYMSDLRSKCLRENKKAQKQRNMIMHMVTRGLRTAFMRWKKKSD